MLRGDLPSCGRPTHLSGCRWQAQSPGTEATRGNSSAEECGRAHCARCRVPDRDQQLADWRRSSIDPAQVSPCPAECVHVQFVGWSKIKLVLTVTLHFRSERNGSPLKLTTIRF